MSTIYARIYKDTLRFVREHKGIALDFVSRKTKFPSAKILAWEDSKNEMYPTLKQARSLAKYYRFPFAGFFMEKGDIKLPNKPSVVNKRTLFKYETDESPVNLALFDLIEARAFLLETDSVLEQKRRRFELSIDSSDILFWAQSIRSYFELDFDVQLKMKSSRQFYLYLRNKIESGGILIQSFTGVDVPVLRGVSIFEDVLPIVGINDEDRYPAKSFSIIHELVHIVKRTNSICNSSFNGYVVDKEEQFCNAVAGEVLAPSSYLLRKCQGATEEDLSLEFIDNISSSLSVSSEVVSRRLYDLSFCTELFYHKILDALAERFEKDKQLLKEKNKEGRPTINRNMVREAIDRTSPQISLALAKGFTSGFLIDLMFLLL